MGQLLRWCSKMDFSLLRSIVIDDKEDEVKPLIEGLNKLGIPFNYYKTNLNLSHAPLNGVRIVFLDFNLNTTSANNAKTIYSDIDYYLRNLISKENGPYILIVWSTIKEWQNYQEVWDYFSSEIVKSDLPKPIAVIDLNKPRNQDSFNKVISAIQENIDLKNIINILLQWEMFGKESLNETLKKILSVKGPFQNIDDYKDKISKKVENDFYNLSKSEMGQKLKQDNFSILTCSQMLLNDFFKEHSDNRIISCADYDKSLVQKIFQNKQNYGIDEKSEMNSLFCLEYKNTFLKPGAFYSIKLSSEDNSPIDFTATNSQHILKHFPNSKLKSELFLSLYDGKNKTSKDKKIRKKKQEATIPVVCEITPECDYAQNKQKSARFVMGLAVPVKTKILTNTKYLYKSPILDIFNGKYILVLNANFIITINISEFRKNKPIFSCRKPFLFEIQHWFANHASRPGKIEFN